MFSPVSTTPSTNKADLCSDFGGVPDPDHAVCCHSDCDTCESSENHIQNNQVCSRSMMLTYDYGTCGQDGVVAPCELPRELSTERRHYEKARSCPEPVSSQKACRLVFINS